MRRTLKRCAVSALGFTPAAVLLALWTDLAAWQALTPGIALGVWLFAERRAERRWPSGGAR